MRAPAQLAAFVHTLLGQDDVRSVVRDRFHLHALCAGRWKG